MSKEEEDFYLYENISSIKPWDGPQYHIAPMWAFHFQTIFMGLVFFAGTPLNAIILFVTIKYKKLRQPLNYILVNISLAGFIFCVFAVFTVFLSSTQGYFFFGRHSATTQKAEREVSRMVVVMVGSFCICYTPYAALAMYMNSEQTIATINPVQGIRCEPLAWEEQL
ncbi:hypothetical protein Chor_008164 [Crotalus horridus]